MIKWSSTLFAVAVAVSGAACVSEPADETNASQSAASNAPAPAGVVTPWLESPGIYCFDHRELRALRDRTLARGTTLTFPGGALKNWVQTTAEIQQTLEQHWSAQELSPQNKLDCVVGAWAVLYDGWYMDLLTKLDFLKLGSGSGSLSFNPYRWDTVGRFLIHTHGVLLRYAWQDENLESDFTLFAGKGTNGPCGDFLDELCDGTQGQIQHTAAFVMFAYGVHNQWIAKILTEMGNTAHEFGYHEEASCWFTPYETGTSPSVGGFDGCSVNDFMASRWGSIYGMTLRRLRDDPKADTDALYRNLAAVTGGLFADADGQGMDTCAQVRQQAADSEFSNDFPIDCDVWADVTNVRTSHWEESQAGTPLIEWITTLQDQTNDFVACGQSNCP